MNHWSIAQRFVSSIRLALVLAMMWAFFTADFSPLNLLVALTFGILIAVWITPVPRREVRINLLRALPFAIWVLVKLLQGAAAVTLEIIRPTPRRIPAMVDVPLDLKCDSQIMLLSHVITLTPGTVVMGISRDQRILRLHGMFVRDRQQFIEEIKNEFEKRVLEVLPCRQT